MQPEKNVLDKNQLQIFYEERLSSLILLCDSTVKQRDWTTLPSKIWIFLPSLTLKNFHPVSAGHVQEYGKIIYTPVLI